MRARSDCYFDFCLRSLHLFVSPVLSAALTTPIYLTVSALANCSRLWWRYHQFYSPFVFYLFTCIYFLHYLLSWRFLFHLKKKFLRLLLHFQPEPDVSDIIMHAYDILLRGTRVKFINHIMRKHLNFLHLYKLTHKKVSLNLRLKQQRITWRILSPVLRHFDTTSDIFEEARHLHVSACLNLLTLFWFTFFSFDIQNPWWRSVQYWILWRGKEIWNSTTIVVHIITIRAPGLFSSHKVSAPSIWFVFVS